MTIGELIYEQGKVCPPRRPGGAGFIGYIREWGERVDPRDLMNPQSVSLAAVGTIRKIKSGRMHSRGELLLVPYPFTNLAPAKPPADSGYDHAG